MSDRFPDPKTPSPPTNPTLGWSRPSRPKVANASRKRKVKCDAVCDRKRDMGQRNMRATWGENVKKGQLNSLFSPLTSLIFFPTEVFDLHLSMRLKSFQ